MIDIDRLRTCLDDAEAAEPWLRSLCVANLPAAHSNLKRLAEHGVTLDLLSQISEQFAATAPTLADPDMAINNLERFIAASRNPCRRPHSSSAIPRPCPICCRFLRPANI